MHWIFIALIPPLLWSLLNHVDKYLISKYAGHTGIGGLAIFSSAFAVIALPIVYLIDRTVFSIGFLDAFLLSVTGALTAFGILFYLYALDKDDASHVVPFWFLIPIFSYILGIIVLGEHIVFNKILGSIITLVGALILSLEFDQGFRVKKAAALLMIASSLVFAVDYVLFKDIALDASFWQSIFWNQFGMFVFGIAALLFVKTYRQDFLKTLKANTGELALLNVIGESVQMIAVFINYYVVLIAPIALVSLVEYTFQPLFVFIEGILLTIFLPRISKEKISHKHILQKLLAIIVMSIGVYLIMV